MPIYEYTCEHCGQHVEKLQKLSEDPLTDCPACDQPSLRRKVSAAGFRLAGGGWYETDFKSGNKRNLAGDKKGSTSNQGGQSGAGNGSQSQTTQSSGSGGQYQQLISVLITHKLRRVSTENSPDLGKMQLFCKV